MKLIKRPFRYRYSNIVLWLIGINFLVFFVMMLFEDRYFISLEISRFRTFRIDILTWFLSMSPLNVTQGHVWTFFTYMFVHGGFTHILFNMFALFIFGTQVERHMGSREFLLFYLLTGTLAGIFSFLVYMFTGNYIVFLVGASGAIFAVQLAYASFFPHSIIYIWGILPIKAWILVLGFAGLEVFFILTGSRGNVAHMTHLAGFAFGWLYLVIRLGKNPLRSMRR